MAEIMVLQHVPQRDNLVGHPTVLQRQHVRQVERLTVLPRRLGLQLVHLTGRQHQHVRQAGHRNQIAKGTFLPNNPDQVLTEHHVLTAGPHLEEAVVLAEVEEAVFVAAEEAVAEDDNRSF